MSGAHGEIVKGTMPKEPMFEEEHMEVEEKTWFRREKTGIEREKKGRLGCYLSHSFQYHFHLTVPMNPNLDSVPV